jgi:hypothetical protein
VDWLTFIVELAKALGWPLAVVVMVVLLRRPLVTLIPTLRHLKYGDFEADFGETLEQAKKEADAANLPPAPEPRALLPGSTPSPFSSALALAQEAPRDAIFESWRVVERAVQRVLRARKIDADRAPIFTQVERLHREGLLPNEALSLIKDLRLLRYIAATYRHDEGVPNAEQAREFVILSQRLVRALEEGSPQSLPPSGGSQQ